MDEPTHKMSYGRESVSAEVNKPYSSETTYHSLGHPFSVVGNNGDHLSLLKHDFRYPYLTFEKTRIRVSSIHDITGCSGESDLVRSLCPFLLVPCMVERFSPWHSAYLVHDVVPGEQGSSNGFC